MRKTFEKSYLTKPDWGWITTLLFCNETRLGARQRLAAESASAAAGSRTAQMAVVITVTPDMGSRLLYGDDRLWCEWCKVVFDFAVTNPANETNCN